MSEDEAEDYHTEQIEILAATEVDLVHAMTIAYAAEAIGIARAAAGAGVPAAISFTTETDGRLPDGTTLADAVAAVDAATAGLLRSQLRAPLPLRISPPRRHDRGTCPERPRERLQEEPCRTR
jgi:hypothetical protein